MCPQQIFNLCFGRVISAYNISLKLKLTLLKKLSTEVKIVSKRAVCNSGVSRVGLKGGFQKSQM